MDERKDILWRVYLVYFAVAVFGVAIIGKVIYIQTVEGEKWQAKVESLTTKYRNIEAVRGNIYASDGSLLATSVPIYEVRMDLNTEALTDEIFNKNIDTLALSLGELYPDKTPIDWKRELTMARDKGARYHLIKRRVKYTELKKMKTFPLFELGRYKGGFIYLQKNKRQRPFRLLAARTIGYERPDIKPVGLEGAYSKELSGVDGKRLMQKIAGGVWMPINDANEVEPEDGSDIVTTIDINIQDVAENALMNQLIKHNADHGCVVVMEVETGHIKAIANLTQNEEGDYSESYNYAVGESTEPGSTFKLASMMAFFEDGGVKLTDSVDCGNGRAQFYDATLTDSKRGGHGVIASKRVFEVSSNIGVAKLAEQVYAGRPQAFIDRLMRMNLDKPLGLEIAGEGDPVVKTNLRDWSGITLPWMSIGYELRLTPLQQLTFYNAVANDGRMVKPMFVKEVRQRGELVNKFEPTITNNSIASQETIEKAHEMMIGVVENGTAKNLRNANYKIAGKTGTARIANGEYGYKYDSKYSYQASFAGFFPAENPKYSCIVIVNAPSNNVYYGNAVAGPIFKEVADKIYALSIDFHEELQPSNTYTAFSPLPYSKHGHQDDLQKVFNEFEVDVDYTDPDQTWAITQTGFDSVVVGPRKVLPNLVPNVTGMGVADALFLLENMGIFVKVDGRGTIKTQSILPGTRIEPGMEILLELS